VENCQYYFRCLIDRCINILLRHRKTFLKQVIKVWLVYIAEMADFLSPIHPCHITFIGAIKSAYVLFVFDFKLLP